LHARCCCENTQQKYPSWSPMSSGEARRVKRHNPCTRKRTNTHPPSCVAKHKPSEFCQPRKSNSNSSTGNSKSLVPLLSQLLAAAALQGSTLATKIAWEMKLATIHHFQHPFVQRLLDFQLFFHALSTHPGWVNGILDLRRN